MRQSVRFIQPQLTAFKDPEMSERSPLRVGVGDVGAIYGPAPLNALALRGWFLVEVTKEDERVYVLVTNAFVEED